MRPSENFRIPAYINTMMENKWLGDKSGQGFSKGEGDDGKSQILTLDLKTMEYGTQSKPKFATVGETKQVDDLKQRLVILHNGKDKAGDFYRAITYRSKSICV